MNVLDLFSGIGGFSLGLERAGMRTVAFCEIEPYCRAVLRKHWPDIIQYDDVRFLTADALRRDGIAVPDLICGGFPCQPVSIAGPRTGTRDSRWLWPEYLRLVEECRPSWVVGENVVGLTDMELDGVLADLDAIGYACRPFDIPACGVGLPTVERHVWIIAAADGERFERFVSETVQDFPLLAWEFPRSYPRESQRWHLPETRVCGRGERVSGRMDRIKALGNAVPPHIPEIIGRAIMQVEGLIE